MAPTNKISQFRHRKFDKNTTKIENDNNPMKSINGPVAGTDELLSPVAIEQSMRNVHMLFKLDPREILEIIMICGQQRINCTPFAIENALNVKNCALNDPDAANNTALTDDEEAIFTIACRVKPNLLKAHSSGTTVKTAFQLVKDGIMKAAMNLLG